MFLHLAPLPNIKKAAKATKVEIPKKSEEIANAEAEGDGETNNDSTTGI